MRPLALPTRPLLPWLTALCLLLLLPHPALAAQRVALLIGNSQYQHEKFLPNPKNDVADLAVALRKLGFEVVVAENQGKIDMEVAINRFVERSNQASTALVFYAGHGALTRKEGQAFLLPVDAKVTDDATLQANGVSVADVLKRLEQAPSPAQLRLVVVDACRTVQSVQRGGDRGLGRGPMPNDQTLLAYSTSEGSPADDGIGRNSPYARSLIKHLPRLANERVLDVFDDVKRDVLKDTSNKQRPEKFTQMDARVSLDGVELLNLTPEQTQWQAALRANTEADYFEYLRTYPNGVYVSAARNALATFKPPPQPDAGPSPSIRPPPGNLGKRVALLVGNSEYPKLLNLKNPTNDVLLLRDSLMGLGFEVSMSLNESRKALLKKIDEFKEKADGSEMALVYLSGYGTSVVGENYFLPSDAEEPKNNMDLRIMSVNFSRLAEDLTTWNVGWSALVVDTGDVNRHWYTSRGSLKGFARMSVEDGPHLYFSSTRPGEVARDGENHSPFAVAVANSIKRGERSFREVIDEIQIDVLRRTGGIQQPWSQTSGNLDLAKIYLGKRHFGYQCDSFDLNRDGLIDAGELRRCISDFKGR